MRLLPDTVSLYNVERVTDPETMEDALTNRITVLRGVFLAPVRAASGNDGKDGAELHIPFSVPAVDAGTGAGRTYADPVSYHAADDKSGLWTLEPSPSCFFARGEVVEPSMSYQEVNAAYPDVYAVTAVETCGYGAAALQHWEVTGA